MATERAAWLERRFGAEIEWLPFDLHPEWPASGVTREDIERRIGPDYRQRQKSMFSAAGLPYADVLEFAPRSLKALVLAEAARSAGVFGAVHAALFRAYWVEARDIGSDEVLTAIAAEHGLSAPALDDPALLTLVSDSTAAAVGAGTSGVPAWAVDEQLMIPGAQPHELFERVLVKLGHPPVEDAS